MTPSPLPTPSDASSIGSRPTACTPTDTTREATPCRASPRAVRHISPHPPSPAMVRLTDLAGAVADLTALQRDNYDAAERLVHRGRRRRGHPSLCRLRAPPARAL